MRTPIAFAVLLALSPPAVGGKGGTTPPPDQQLGYRLLGKSSSSLILANEDASNTSTVYTSPSKFRFDLGPRSSGKIAIVDVRGSGSAAKLYLVSTSVGGNGRLVGGTPVELAPARLMSDVDISPDGTKIAYACCSDGSNETLAVYDVTTGTVTPWATATYFWNISWFKGGTALAYSTLGPTAFYEVSAPGAAPRLLLQPRPDGSGEVTLDSVHTSPASLLVSYNDSAGHARIGIWSSATGQFSNSDIASSTIAFNGNLNCTDTKLAFLGSANPSGGQIWYIRDLATNDQRTFSKSSSIALQYWGC